MSETAAPVNDKREIFGWAMYDWANSAFSTTVGTVFLGPYVASLASAAAKGYPDGFARLGSLAVAPDLLFPTCVSISVLAQVLFLPILGAIADYSHRRKRMLQIFATLGGLLTMLLFFVTASVWWLGGLLFIGANLAFGAAVVFYNAYLPDIASEDQRDRVSSFGWAMGYLGDGILLALNLAFFIFHERLGVPRILRFESIWRRLEFGGFYSPSPHGPVCVRAMPGAKFLQGESYASVGFSQLCTDVERDSAFSRDGQVPGGLLPVQRRHPDGDRRVLDLRGGSLDSGGLELDLNTLTVVILIIQFTAFFGALLWGRIAAWIGAKQSIIVSLVIWSAVVIYAYFGLKGENRVLEFALLGVVIALVLGGSQAISRSLFAQMIPQGREAEFYSFYEVSDRGTSWLGPLLFGLTNQIFGSLRPAILSLIVFFVAGLIALPFVNDRKAIEAVKRRAAAET